MGRRQVCDDRSVLDERAHPMRIDSPKPRGLTFVESAAIAAVATCDRWHAEKDPKKLIEAWRRSIAILNNALRLDGLNRQLDEASERAVGSKTVQETLETTMPGIGPDGLRAYR